MYGVPPMKLSKKVSTTPLEKQGQKVVVLKTCFRLLAPSFMGGKLLLFEGALS